MPPLTVNHTDLMKVNVHKLGKNVSGIEILKEHFVHQISKKKIHEQELFYIRFKVSSDTKVKSKFQFTLLFVLNVKLF